MVELDGKGGREEGEGRRRGRRGREGGREEERKGTKRGREGRKTMTHTFDHKYRAGSHGQVYLFPILLVPQHDSRAIPRAGYKVDGVEQLVFLMLEGREGGKSGREGDGCNFALRKAKVVNRQGHTATHVQLIPYNNTAVYLKWLELHFHTHHPSMFICLLYD